MRQAARAPVRLRRFTISCIASPWRLQWQGRRLFSQSQYPVVEGNRALLLAARWLFETADAKTRRRPRLASRPPGNQLRMLRVNDSSSRGRACGDACRNCGSIRGGPRRGCTDSRNDDTRLAGRKAPAAEPGNERRVAQRRTAVVAAVELAGKAARSGRGRPRHLPGPCWRLMRWWSLRFRVRVYF